MTADWFLEQFGGKHGFNSGDAVPPQAEQVRDLLVEAINRGLGEDSEVEAYGYDRTTHNPYLICFRKRGSTRTDEDVPTPERVHDIIAALDEASYLGEVVKVVVEVEPEEVRREILDEALAGVAAGEE